MIQNSKIVNAEKFNELYLALTEADKNTFSVICNKLLNENFIYGQSGYDEISYRNILRLRDIVQRYFGMIDYELYHDDVYKIFYLKSINIRTKVKLRKLETVLVLVCAKLYSIKSLEVTIGNGIEIPISIEELMDEVNKTRIYQKNRLYKTDILNALRTLKKYMIIDTKTSDFESSDFIIILPTILYMVTDTSLDCLEQRIKALSLDNNDEGAQDDEPYED